MFMSALSRVMGLKLYMASPLFGSFFSSVTAPRLTKPGMLPFCCQLQYTAAKTSPNKSGIQL
uniref:Uncharacterized protein n=1 Tax=Octopus bimaculoides TaxID=37653 RepID=A0A0L8G936_OCTBM